MPEAARPADYDRRLQALETAISELARQREAQQRTLDELHAVVNDLRDLLQAWETTRGAFHLLRALGNAARWLITVAAAVAALWLWMKSSFK
ncbi:hypothetical protein CEK28_10435 [Xenophilus sp. AP218F]|nr:hypothetical protein [Chromobacterium sp. ASV5]OWY38937.1 hypothetical protein CEK28_10435 [Xenophilus sp. AP218F]